MSQLSKIEAEILHCDKCRLSGTAAKKVPGCGDPNAKVMIVGEAPGREENSSGVPFVGDAGKLLDKALEAIEVPRSSLFISNILHCWPPGNAITTDIREDCIPKCIKYLEAQIEAIRPTVIVALGATSAQLLIDVHSSIGKIRGRMFAGPCSVLTAPTWHPAYILRMGGIDGGKSKQKIAAKEFLSDLMQAFKVAGVKHKEG